MENFVIQKSTLKFLKDLTKNNDRDWFNAHKSTFLSAQQNMYDFIDRLVVEMNKHDEIESAPAKQILFRIYRDIRFSKDKTPYNPCFAFSLQRAGKLRRGGYHVSIKPGKSLIGCGFFGPDPGDLKRIRQDIEVNYGKWKKLLNSKGIKDNFGEMQGEKVATAPKGFSINDPAIELLRNKQFIFRHKFTDEEVVSENFLKEVNRIFKTIRPYFNYMSEVLTTNLDGQSVF